MKRIGSLALGAMIFLMSCGGATDGKLSTDTTTFPSQQKPMTDTASSIQVTDTNNPRTPAPNGAPGSSPETRKSTPGMGGQDTTKKH